MHDEYLPIGEYEFFFKTFVLDGLDLQCLYKDTIVEQSTVPKILSDSMCGSNFIFCNYWSFEPTKKWRNNPNPMQNK